MNLNRLGANHATSSGNHSRDRVPVDLGPFGQITAAGGDEEYPIGYSHLQIPGCAREAEVLDEAADQAVFPEVDTSTVYGHTHPVRIGMPIFASGSARLGREQWHGLAAGAAVSGIPLVVGEDVCGSDPGLELDKNGRVTRSPEMERLVKVYRDWQDEHGEIIVQMSAEDARLGVAQYAVEKLSVETIELKWGQGAHSTGDQLKVRELPRALELLRRGYLVTPNPADPAIQAAFEAGAIPEFERHRRQGFVDEEGFLRAVDDLRRQAGVKRVLLKIAARDPRELAMALKWSSQARGDLLTIDGPASFYVQCLLYRLAEKLAGRGGWIPDLAMGGGFTGADHLFKVLALGAPYFRAVRMGRALAQAVLGTAMSTCVDRLRTGLARLMAGARRFRLDALQRSDLVSLSEEAAKVSGIPHIMDAGMEEAERILNG